MSEKERSRAKFLAKQAERRAAQDAKKPRKSRKSREQNASREEQQARYIDSGPLAWDNTDSDS